MVKNYAVTASKLNSVTSKTDTRTGTLKEQGGKGHVVRVSEIPKLIGLYGITTSYSKTLGRRFSFGPPYPDVWTLTITLLYPGNHSVPKDFREVRTELYLQAESIVEILKQNKVQFVKPPRIILDGTVDQIEGTMEVEIHM